MKNIDKEMRATRRGHLRAERSRKEGFPPDELRGVPQRQMPATGNPSSALAPVEQYVRCQERKGKKK